MPEQRRPLHLGAHPDLSRYTVLVLLVLLLFLLVLLLTLDVTVTRSHLQPTHPSLVHLKQCTDIQLILYGQI